MDPIFPILGYVEYGHTEDYSRSQTLPGTWTSNIDQRWDCLLPDWEGFAFCCDCYG